MRMQTKRRTVAAAVTGLACAIAVSGVLVTEGLAATAKQVKVVPSGGTCTSLFCFRPKTVKVLHGNAVTWTNTTGATHTLTRCTAAACQGHGGGTGTQSGFGDSNLAPSGKYTFTFTKTGTYLYYCAIHGYAVMHGTVKVG